MPTNVTETNKWTTECAPREVSVGRTPPAADAPRVAFQRREGPAAHETRAIHTDELVVEITLRDRLQGRLPCY